MGKKRPKASVSEESNHPQVRVGDISRRVPVGLGKSLGLSMSLESTVPVRQVLSRLSKSPPGTLFKVIEPTTREVVGVFDPRFFVEKANAEFPLTQGRDLDLGGIIGVMEADEAERRRGFVHETFTQSMTLYQCPAGHVSRTPKCPRDGLRGTPI